MLPDLCLAPHEAGDLESDEPLCAPAHFRIHLKNWLGGDDYLARRIETTPHYPQWWARREHDGNAPILRLDRRFDVSAQTLQEDIRMGAFHRHIYFDGDGNLASSRDDWFRVLVVDHLGQSSWENCDGDDFLFRWQLNAELRWPPQWRARKTCAQIEREVRAMRAQTNSHCALGWDWLQLGPDERNQMSLHLERGTWKEWKNLLFAVAWSDPEWIASDASNQGWEWNFDLFDFNETAAVDGLETAICGWVGNHRNYTEFNARHKRLLTLLFTDFGAAFHRDLDRHARELPLNQREDCECVISIPVPTQHERLEKLLQLRDFLRDKVSPDELGKLMGN